MNKSTRKNSVFILSCLLSGATLLLACLLIGHCVQIYRAGVAPENLTEAGVRIMDIYSPPGLSGCGWRCWPRRHWPACAIRRMSAPCPA